jgi:hypothetical protein
MGILKEETDRVPARMHAAVEHFVENTADGEVDEAAVWRWEGWCNDPRNLEEYAEIVKMTRQVLVAPRPSPSSGAELVADAALEVLSDLGA